MSVRVFDTHCHLNHDDFADEVDGAIDRASRAGVERLVVVGYDVPSSRAAVELSERFEVVYASVGVHPHEARTYTPSAGEALRALCSHPRVVAVGEVGLDFHYDFSPRADQAAAFQAQIELGTEAGLPLIVHCREAYPETLDALEAAGCPSGVMHCWAGTATEAERACALGLYLGFGGVVTFKNAAETREVAAAAPAGRVLLETDAPYLAPVPHRGRRNEPAWVVLVAERMAEVRGVSVSELALQTSANARALFGKLG